ARGREDAMAARVWLSTADCRMDELAALVERRTDPADYPFAVEISRNVPIYDGAALRAQAPDADRARALMAEWVAAMTDGPGIVVVRGALDGPVVDRVTGHFAAMIAEQHAAGSGGADHFAKPGANDRVWNALEKLALRDPEAFAAYYGNPAVALVCEAW